MSKRNGSTHHATGQDGLKVPRSVSQNDKDNVLLGSQTMDPSGNAYPRSSVGSSIPDLRLYANRQPNIGVQAVNEVSRLHLSGPW